MAVWTCAVHVIPVVEALRRRVLLEEDARRIFSEVLMVDEKGGHL